METRDAFVQRIPDCKEESVQAVKSSTDSIVDAEYSGTNTVMQTAPALWSDFDRTPFADFYWDVSQQTSPIVMNDSECQFTLDVASQEVQTTRLSGEDVSDKCCGTKIDMEDNAAQATAEIHEVASGQPDSESWIKVELDTVHGVLAELTHHCLPGIVWHLHVYFSIHYTCRCRHWLAFFTLSECTIFLLLFFT